VAPNFYFGIRNSRQPLARLQPNVAKLRVRIETEGKHAMISWPPDPEHISHAMSQAMAPAFSLAAVAAFSSIMHGRMTAVIDRIRSLNEIAEDDTARGHLKSDIPRLRQRVRLLNNALHLALLSGICTSLLLVVSFGSAFLHLRHEYGAGLLFFVTIGLLGAALFRFSQEVRIGMRPITTDEVVVTAM